MRQNCYYYKYIHRGETAPLNRQNVLPKVLINSLPLFLCNYTTVELIFDMELFFYCLFVCLFFFFFNAPRSIIIQRWLRDGVSFFALSTTNIRIFELSWLYKVRYFSTLNTKIHSIIWFNFLNVCYSICNYKFQNVCTSQKSSNLICQIRNRPREFLRIKWLSSDYNLYYWCV